MSFWGSAASMELNARLQAERDEALKNAEAWRKEHDEVKKNGFTWVEYARELEDRIDEIESNIRNLAQEKAAVSEDNERLVKKLKELEDQISSRSFA